MEEDCTCVNPPFNYLNFEKKEIGISKDYWEISIEECKKCHRKWLRCFTEQEAFSRSGRWYRGLISDEVAKTINTENAVKTLENLEWHFIGGSYFESSGKKILGKAKIC